MNKCSHNKNRILFGFMYIPTLFLSLRPFTHHVTCVLYLLLADVESLVVVVCELIPAQIAFGWMEIFTPIRMDFCMTFPMVVWVVGEASCRLCCCCGVHGLLCGLRSGQRETTSRTVTTTKATAAAALWPLLRCLSVGQQ